MIHRNITPLLQLLASPYPVMTLTGPRPSGKTTLAKTLFPHKHYATLEDPNVRRFASDDPRGVRGGVSGGIGSGVRNDYDGQLCPSCNTNCLIARSNVFTSTAATPHLPG